MLCVISEHSCCRALFSTLPNKQRMPCPHGFLICPAPWRSPSEPPGLLLLQSGNTTEMVNWGSNLGLTLFCCLSLQLLPNLAIYSMCETLLLRFFILLYFIRKTPKQVLVLGNFKARWWSYLGSSRTFVTQSLSVRGGSLRTALWVL